MKKILHGLLSATAVLVLVVATPVRAEGSPTPYADYRAWIVAFQEANASSGSAASVDDVLTTLRASLDRTDAEIARLEAITPEDCYADAHAEMVAYRRYVVATMRDTLPLIEKADSVMGMVPMILAADATIRAEHPTAYVEDQGSMTGFTSDPLNILDTMATCDPVTAPASPSPTTSVAPGGPAGSVTPGAVIHTWTGRDIVALPGGPIVVSWTDEGCALTLTWESESGVDVEIVHTADTADGVNSVTTDLPAGPGRLDVSAGCFTDAPPWTVEFSTP